MTDDDPTDEDLYRRVAALLGPGDVDLRGLVVHTDLGGDQESLMHRLTVQIGEVIADHAGAGETYVYSGTDDPEFGLNQHQGLTIAEDSFVWECQQLLRDGSYDLVFYYETSAAHRDILADLEDRGHRVVGVDGPTTA